MTRHNPADIATNQLLLGEHCFIVKARSLPNGFNQRPGVTLLLSNEQPLELEIEGLPTTSADNWLLAPEVRRRFVRKQTHTSITVEPGHPSYTRLLRWAGSGLRGSQKFELSSHDQCTINATITQRAFDDWLLRLLEQHQQPPSTPNPRLEYLFSLIAASTTDDISAEQIWQQFRARYPSTQAHCSHWLQDCIGIPLRKLILWHKLRRAMESLSESNSATEVAHAAGFADSAHLSRICLRTFGLRPSQANDHKILQVSRLGKTDTAFL